ncbi:hypothetical protein HHI36_014302 [Cryptolaemus montrouzieri]|uniref:Uncharacterized protein n=1 Tax=Cryptolaemus montrouzieri TaxID=559131 RepID=A0ABD2N297_9CUCU
MADIQPFACHNNSELTCYVCVKCFSIFHKSCAERDWKAKLISIKDQKVLCCDDEVENDVFTAMMDDIQKKNEHERSREAHVIRLREEKELLFIKFGEI